MRQRVFVTAPKPARVKYSRVFFSPHMLEASKQILETTALPVEAVAQEVGYEDAGFFGRLFRRRVGLTPAQHRKRFQSLRQALHAAVPASAAAR